MEAIFHEKQEGSLCAQHCLNSLLQGPYFTAVDLSTLAEKLDDEERQRMAECGEESEDYQNFLRQPSGNMDDSGYFSVQVISSALQVWGLELVPFSSTDKRVKSALTNPCQMQAFICNYRGHWFTIRHLGNQWFNLNSLLSKPELISDTYLSLFLAQLKNDGYSIFVVFGELPECEADQLLRIQPATPRVRTHTLRPKVPEDDLDLQTALRLSLNDEIDGIESHATEDIDQDFREAMRMSLLGGRARPDPFRTELNENDRELQEALRLSLHECKDDDDEDALLRKAIHMSLEC